jgi:farnesyl diphosphate synthase
MDTEITELTSFESRLRASAAETQDLLMALLSPDAASDEIVRPANLLAAMRHGTLNGGKRLRPFLVTESAALFGAEHQAALRIGAALECLHCYSLIHDDLPAMDDDDLRRGQPTVHKAFDEATAILAGDSLLALAFEWIAHPDTHPDPFVRAELALEVARAAGPAGMAGGQAMDLAAEKTSLKLDEVTRLQALKTGALIAVSVEAGAILGKVPVEGRTGLRGYARDIGLAFQIADDLLDVEGDEDKVGKKLHKDEQAGKETFVSLLGVERARAQAEMLVEQAIEHLHGFGAEADLLRALARFILARDR